MSEYGPLTITDNTPVRPRRRRDIKGKSENGIEVTAMAFAEPLPDSLEYGPFRGEGAISMSRRGNYILSHANFDDIPEIIALLRDVLEAAVTPHDLGETS